MWTAFASVFSLLLGYSRVPFAAARDGNYFRMFEKVHPRHRFPYVSLLVMGGIAAVFCFFRLADVIAALVVIRILVQFLAQIVGVIVLRVRRPDLPRPFRMWLYPLPALFALARVHLRADFTEELFERGALRGGAGGRRSHDLLHSCADARRVAVRERPESRGSRDSGRVSELVSLWLPAANLPEDSPETQF